jgi:Ca-activated chloride channel family protein
VNNIFFEHLEIFYLLAVFIFCDIFCKAKSNSILFPNISMFSKMEIAKFNSLFYLKWIMLISLLFALSSPYKILNETEKPKEGLNIALMLDTSDSMRARGFDQSDKSLNRFQVVQRILGDFIEKRENDNLGLVVFGEYAFVSSPLTFDKHVLRKMVDNLHIGIAGKSTAIYDAIGQTVSLLKSEENSTNIAILLTDGINTAGVLERDKAIELARNRDIKIYTIGIGRQGEINPLDLQDMAFETGGEFFLARDGTELEKIYEYIDKLEKREIKDTTYTIKEYLYFYPLLLAILSLTIFITIKNRREFY